MADGVKVLDPFGVHVALHLHVLGVPNERGGQATQELHHARQAPIPIQIHRHGHSSIGSIRRSGRRLLHEQVGSDHRLGIERFAFATSRSTSPSRVRKASRRRMKTSSMDPFVGQKVPGNGL